VDARGSRHHFTPENGELLISGRTLQDGTGEVFELEAEGPFTIRVGQVVMVQTDDPSLVCAVLRNVNAVAKCFQ